MKELKFGSFVNRYGETVYRLLLEIRENHLLEIITEENDAASDLWYTDAPRYLYTWNTVFPTLPCKWGNSHGVMLKRKLKRQFNSRDELIRSEYPIVDTPKTIRKTMLKRATQYISRRY